MECDVTLGRKKLLRREKKSTRKTNCRRGNFRKNRSGRRDRSRPKIVKIGVILAIFRTFEVSCVGNTHGRVWEPQIVMSESDTLSCLGTTDGFVWEPDIALFGNDILSCLGTTDCPDWEPHIVLLGNRTMSCLGIINSLVW